MSDDDRSQPGRPGGEAEAPSLVAIPFLERKLDDLYDSLKEARCAQILLEAKASLRARNYSQARQLVEAARQRCAPSTMNQRRRPAPAPSGGRAVVGVSADVLTGLATVLRLLQPLSDWHQRQPKAAAAEIAPQAATLQRNHPPAEFSDGEPANEVAEESPDLARQYSTVLLERGAFSQLLTAAQHCGLVPNPDVIIGVRDRDFPAGKYQRAFEMIDTQYHQFSALASRRLAQLRREEIQYKAGTLKMSMKDWLVRQRQITEQNQKIDRARRHFTRVLDALRVIRTSSSE